MVHVFPSSKGHNSGINWVPHHGEAQKGDNKQHKPEEMLRGQYGGEE